ncbi:tetraspanin-9-like [Saccostrea echinata]|uniref:tetraspanin-9-like n=1 Tax=Saccostrea echinata TaxID=191078 RepID=UPI002A7EE9EB|nr:tetraspanin-9-like [Saccostrea echinata]
MGLSNCGKFGKVYLSVINAIFLLLGLGLLVAGILVRINAISSDVTPALNSVNVANYKLGDLSHNLSIIFIVIGAFIVIVAGLGLIGACCEVKCMLITYAILVLIVLIIKLAAVILWFQMRNEFDDTVKKAMKDSLDKNFVNDTLDSENSVSNAWNYVFLTFDCCGLDPMMVKNGSEFSKTPWCTKKGSCKEHLATIPRTCCEGVDNSNYLMAKTECYLNVTKGYNEKGCYEAVEDLISTYGNAFIGISITVIVIELLAIVFAIIICRRSGSDHDSKAV